MTKLFIGTLKGVAFDWFRSLSLGSISSWIDLEARFLSRFYEVTQRWPWINFFPLCKKKENLSVITLPMLLQTCRHNFLDQVKIRMGAVKAHTWKEPVEQAEIAEKSPKKFEPSTPKGKWGMNNKGRGEMAQFSQAKGKETMSVELSGDTPPKTKKSGVNNQEF